MKEALTLPPEIIDGIIAIVSGILGWLTRWLQTKKTIEINETENAKLKEIVMQYNSAAQDALKTTRRAQPPKEPLE